ncbi:DNA polymerase epsilon subunit 3-like [Watersipora subatra]|uniref:DNA polymerase epsilon subunit 3-like n=1 Tax=Watersipora subatra TaxID=2589382 RepID=UPI00355B5EB5
MAERPEDLNLPNAVVTRIIKEALPPGVNIGKDARLAISKAASVFVLYTTSCANNNALKSKRKTISLNDVYGALQDMEFDSFLEPLQAQLAAHKLAQASKKSRKTASRLQRVTERVALHDEPAQEDIRGEDETGGVTGEALDTTG